MSSTMRPGYSWRTASIRARVPSVDPSLTTMTSRASGSGTAWTRASTAAIVDSSLYTGITIVSFDWLMDTGFVRALDPVSEYFRA